MKLYIPNELPIAARADELTELLRTHQVVVVAGETGSGKTTQLPKLALLAGAERIVHTQPRRIAARSVSARIANECEVELGQEVGYAVRFDDRSGPETKIRLVTDGLLLSELTHDPDLKRYDTVIIDEAHERSLAIDFLLGYLVDLTQRRPELKVIVTSATIDVERFATLFDRPGRAVPIMEVSGRTYPVEIRYRPLLESDANDLPEAVAAAVRELPKDGDILVFTSGEREIRDIVEHLAGKFGERTELLPLHGRLPAHEQQRIFTQGSRRRIVVSTNVAETSLTVPGIRYVIDGGNARISRFSTRLKVQRLPIEPISQASAAQRAGRCGRVADGICIRLYSEEDHDGRPEFTDPEIRRTNLASVLLQMAVLDLGSVEDFAFLDPPEHRAVASGRNLLRELGAFDGERITRRGRKMARFPVDPRMARMLLAAEQLGCLADVLVIVAAMSIQDPRERPLDSREEADRYHRRFASPTSDFLSYLGLWNYLREKRAELSHTKFRKMCLAEHLHYLRVREWQDVHSQLARTAKEMGLRAGSAGADEDDIHRALLTGLLSHVAIKDETGREYTGARGSRLVVWPGSGLAKKPPAWLMAGELIETSHLWARTAAAIEPAWIEETADHLLVKQYAEPRWSKRRGAAVASLRATLYGLPVVTNRTVLLSKVDPELARELFIKHALVGGEWRTHHAFVKRNDALLAKLQEVEDRTRRGDLHIDEHILEEFFAERIPENIVSARHFDSWWRKQSKKTPQLLDLEEAALIQTPEQLETDFPTTWTSQSREYELSYLFEPGSLRDGIEVRLSLADLATANPEQFRWLVPGHRAELVSELLRTLPKTQRRHFVPVPDTAQQVVEQLDPAGAPLLEQLAQLLSQRHPVAAADFNPSLLPTHLTMTFVVHDDGKELGRGKDLERLRAELMPKVNAEVDRTFADFERTGITQWDFGALPDHLERDGLIVYPTLLERGKNVDLTVVRSPAEANVGLVRGTTRLLAGQVPNPTKHLAGQLSTADKLLLATAPSGDIARLVNDAWLAALDELVLRHGGPPRDRTEFARLKEQVRPEMVPLTEQNLRAVLAAMRVRSRIQLGDDDASADVRVQLSWLLYPGFIRDMGVAMLPRLSVYLLAAQRRLTTTKSLETVNELELRFHEMTAELTEMRRLAPDVQHARWSLEELRVSVVAQDLRTAFSVSTKKVAATLDELAATGDFELSRRPKGQ